MTAKNETRRRYHYEYAVCLRDCYVLGIYATVVAAAVAMLGFEQIYGRREIEIRRKRVVNH